MLLNVPEIMVAAWEVRRRSALSAPPYSTHQIMAACFPDVLVTGEDLPKGVAEMVVNHGGKKTILYNRRMPVPTHRTAIAHALGHLVFDDPIQGRHVLSSDYHATDVVERRADLFAGELLVPLSDLDATFHGDLFPQNPLGLRTFSDEVDRCASRFSVLTGFIRWRLWDLMHFRRSNYFVRSSKHL